MRMFPRHPGGIRTNRPNWSSFQKINSHHLTRKCFGTFQSTMLQPICCRFGVFVIFGLVQGSCDRQFGIHQLGRLGLLGTNQLVLGAAVFGGCRYAQAHGAVGCDLYNRPLLGIRPPGLIPPLISSFHINQMQKRLPAFTAKNVVGNGFAGR